jgi:UDPglucose 6-dehydrogenase
MVDVKLMNIAGAMTGIVLASNNPETQFSIIDTNQRLIAAWKSDHPPFTEPGIEDILFDNECLAIEGANNDTITANTIAAKSELEVTRRRKLQNLSFSSDVQAAVATAQMIFLCLEMVSNPLIILHRFPLIHDIGRV